MDDNTTILVVLGVVLIIAFLIIIALIKDKRKLST